MSFDFDLTAPFTPEFSTRDQIEHRHKIEPIQIVCPKEGGGFKLNENGLNSILKHNAIQNKKIVIVGIAGAFRKGKSFLLNFFLEYLYCLQKAQQNDVKLEWLTDETQVNGFHWKTGAKRDTVGIWMWGEPIMIEAINGEKYAVVLMDTQGTFDNISTYNQSTTIFALSTLLSSIQCYNLTENIPEDALQNLSLFVEYGRLALKESQYVGKPFQNLNFIIRDFKNPEEFPYGIEGGREFLSQVLEIHSDLEEELKDVRLQLQACFDEINCYLMPHPGHKVAERNSFRGHVKDIRSIFKEEVKKMVENLLNPHSLKPKSVNGRELTCKKMIEFTKQFVKVFEGSDIPQPKNILNANCHLLCIESAHEAKLAYCRGMNRATIDARMLSEKRLLEAHIKNGITALNIFDKCPKIGSSQVRSEYLARLQEDINAELERYKKLNEDKRVTGLASIALAYGDSIFFGLGLAGCSTIAIGGTYLTLTAGIVAGGIVAIPITFTTLFGIWSYVFINEKIKDCKNQISQESENKKEKENEKVGKIFKRV
ncbi:Atlastin [Strongyloides ratti]|uniref:Atlastin n=1 Tax=Strongyloides ratti TaxID=34506 RepID=A0A090N0X7_STRRB|nr:Atlastin [Strongyloides ratti]CEF71458.1 Atlastin [Strongyloides ratti]